ncbi:MAG: DUF5106 domain-containing protein [Rikenellaceae bacterium]|nr:DUF5106 domain-containing protein [Rikenellaceae bacterium]
MKHLYLGLVLLVSMTLPACRGSQSATTPAHLFPLPQAPRTMDHEAQIDYMAAHYWDHFRFADSLALVQADTAEMLRHFSQFSALALRCERHRVPMDTLMRRASTSPTALRYFAFLAEQVLHDPNSPLRSSELYLPILEAQLQAPQINPYERIVLEHDLKLAMQNRLGEPANDFRFLTRDGKESSLYEVQADHTLLFFSNPDCSMCSMLKELLLHSAPIVERLTDGRLKILLLYPDEDLQAWRTAPSEAGHGVIDACDAEGRLRQEGLYDLRAIPSIYLLDRDKRVVVKDSTDPREVEEALL